MVNKKRICTAPHHFVDVDADVEADVDADDKVEPHRVAEDFVPAEDTAKRTSWRGLFL
jgi:hypothetical protein